MKVLFLDIDGVLNCEASRLMAHNQKAGDFATHRAWLDGAVEELKRIIKETGCQIVISSDWRLCNVPNLQAAFKNEELPNWLGFTPELGKNNWHNMNRGREVAAWIAAAEAEGDKVESFAIVDDNDWFMPDQQSRFVHTSDTQGMTKDDADDIIWILNHGPRRKDPTT